jgi:RNA polymerase sigma factor (sigma-70 family)
MTPLGPAYLTPARAPARCGNQLSHATVTWGTQSTMIRGPGSASTVSLPENSGGASVQVPPSPTALAADNLKLAFHVAKSYLRRARVLGFTREDLQQEAVVGLLRASYRFDPTVGAPFSNFAGLAIRHHLHNVLIARRHRPWRGFPANSGGVAFDHEDPHAEPPDAWAMFNDEKEQVARLLRRLNSREQLIIQMYFWNDMSFAQIGALVGLSGERIRQVFDRSIGRLRRAVRA